MESFMNIVPSSAIFAIFGIVGGIIGYFFRYYLDKKKEIISENMKIKRESYKEFVDIVVDIFKSTKNTNNDKQSNELNQKVEELLNFHKKFLLYASPELVIAFGDFMQHLYIQGENKDHKKTIKLLSNVIKIMRSDLNLSNTDLGEYGEKMFRPLINDYNKIF